MWQIYSQRHLLRISIGRLGMQWVYGNGGQLEVNLRLFHFSFGHTDFFVYMEGYSSTLFLLTSRAGF